MTEQRNTVLIYCHTDRQGASHIQFAARQFDFKPVNVTSVKEAWQCLKNDHPVIAFLDAGVFLFEDIPTSDTAVVPIIDQGAMHGRMLEWLGYQRVLYAPVSLPEVMSTIKNILDRDVERRKDYVYHMVRSKIMLRHFLFLLDRMAADGLMMTDLGEGVYEFCVGTCRYAISGDPPDGDGATYHLLTVSVSHGKRQCALYEGCKLHEFSRWLQDEHKAVFNIRPCDALPQMARDVKAETIRDFIVQLLERQEAAIARLYELKKNFCSTRCDMAKNGTDFKEGHILVSDWADMFRNQCVYCPQPECPLNRFFELLVHRLKTI